MPQLPPTALAACRANRRALVVRWLARLLSAAMLALCACTCRSGRVSNPDQNPLLAQPAQLDFGRTFVGSTSTRTLELTNPNLTRVQLALTIDSPFEVSSPLTSIEPGSVAHLELHFTPPSAAT